MATAAAKRDAISAALVLSFNVIFVDLSIPSVCPINSLIKLEKLNGSVFEAPMRVRNFSYLHRPAAWAAGAAFRLACPFSNLRAVPLRTHQQVKF